MKWLQPRVLRLRLGELGEAKRLLKRAFEISPELKAMAWEDPDLDAIFGVGEISD